MLQPDVPLPVPMPNHHPPQLPEGDASLFSTLSQSLSFHSSPESFITSRKAHPPSTSTPQHIHSAAPAPHNKVIRARILNRNVAVITSYQHCHDILNAGHGDGRSSVSAVEGKGKAGVDASSFAACPAYKDLMADFFPAPNLLLSDHPHHAPNRAAWNQQFATFPTDVAPLIRSIVQTHTQTLVHGTSIDLYDNMKSLSRAILLGIFLHLSPTTDPQPFNTITNLQETLLRGQFSLFPISVNNRFWRSPRSKGIHARQQLQTILKQHIQTQSQRPAEKPSCPLLRGAHVPIDEIASNVLLFTSSIAVKALASLLTATLLNLYLHPSTPSLANRIRQAGAAHPADGENLLRSVLAETERLSPPVVGIMRRVMRDVVLANNTVSSTPSSESVSPAPDVDQHNNYRHDPSSTSTTTPTTPDTLIPAGWDIWLYFAHASRDPAIYTRPETFQADRFLASPPPSLPHPNTASTRAHPSPHVPPTPPPPSGLSFSTGPKTCLAAPLMRDVAHAVSRALIDADVLLEGVVGDRGVRGWLGWEEDGVGPVDWERGLKQVPVQRPRGVVRVRVLRGRGG